MAVRRTNLYRDIGDTGLNTTGWGEIGDEFLREWQGAGEKARRVREMLYNSPVIGALRMAVEMPIRDIDWHFVSDEVPSTLTRKRVLKRALTMRTRSSCVVPSTLTRKRVLKLLPSWGYG